MASQSLYRKWRSQTFSALVGQEEIVKTLKNALSSDGKLSHAYLFIGPRGTGKTSTARLLAKTINCPNAKNGEPCNQCSQCREITSGSSFNVIEIDAASNRGIDSIRELREKVMVPPSTGKYKVYILDEAHMLTTEAFNALLKTLEEPPPHAIFVLATTDVHKMLPTVLSRCQQFNFKRITTRQIVEHLLFVGQQEEITLGHGAAELIARAASGGMRDALSLLDQAIAYCGKEITLPQVQAMLGVADPRAIQHLIQHVAQLESGEGLHLIHELAEAGADLRQINGQVADYWRALMLAKAGANISVILDTSEDDVREMMECTHFFTLEELTECARTFAQNDLMQKSLGTPQLGLELAFLMCVEHHRRAASGQNSSAAHASSAATRPVSSIPVSRPSAANPPSLARSQPVSTPPPAPVVPAVSVVETPVSASAEPIPAVPPSPAAVEPVELVVSVVRDEPDGPDEDDSLSIDYAAFEPPPLAPTYTEALPERASPPPAPLVSPALAPLVPAPAAGAPTLTAQQVRESWEHIKKRVKSKSGNPKENSTVSALLADFSPIAVEGTAEHMIIVIQARHDFQYKQMVEKERSLLVQWAIKLEFGQECQIKLIAPNQVYASTQLPIQETASRSANSALAVAPRQPAHREPPAAPPARTAPAAPPARTSPPEARTAQKAPQVPPEPAREQRPTPLARTSVVRENTPVAFEASAPDGETRQETVRKKAEHDPVVKEVARIFKAKIKEVHLK